MKRLALLIGALSLALVLPGCGRVLRVSRTVVNMDRIDVSLAPLQRSDYEILGDVTGMGQVEAYSRGKGKVRMARPEDRVVGLITGDSMTSLAPRKGMSLDMFALAREIATYNAIASIPGADALLFPRYEQKLEIVGKEWMITVKVFAKAIRIKPDHQAAQ